MKHLAKKTEEFSLDMIDLAHGMMDFSFDLREQVQRAGTALGMLCAEMENSGGPHERKRFAMYAFSCATELKYLFRHSGGKQESIEDILRELKKYNTRGFTKRH